MSDDDVESYTQHLVPKEALITVSLHAGGRLCRDCTCELLVVLTDCSTSA